MKVVCISLPTTVDGIAQESSPWVTLHNEYQVVSLLAERRGVQLQIVTDDGRSLGWFDSNNFMTVDGRIPQHWVARIGEGGSVELAPEAWLAPGFWESYYDGDSTAIEAVEFELGSTHGEEGLAR